MKSIENQPENTYLLPRKQLTKIVGDVVNNRFYMSYRSLTFGDTKENGVKARPLG